MQQVKFKSRHLFILVTTVILTFTACSEWAIPTSLPGTYIGQERIIIRYDRDGQLIFRDDYVNMSMIIDSTGNVTGMVGEATFETCIVKQNRSWIGRQLGIKTDFLITGMLKGHTFDKDTLVNKNISIPFNIDKDELKGSLFINAKSDSYPMIKIMKLKKIKIL